MIKERKIWIGAAVLSGGAVLALIGAAVYRWNQKRQVGMGKS